MSGGAMGYVRNMTWDEWHCGRCKKELHGHKEFNSFPDEVSIVNCSSRYGGIRTFSPLKNYCKECYLKILDEKSGQGRLDFPNA